MVRLQKWLHLAEFVRLLQIFKLRYLMNQKIFRLVADLRFSIFILLLVFVVLRAQLLNKISQLKYIKLIILTNPVFGFLTWDRILQFGLDHVYSTWWFFSLIFYSV
jgi:cytochrome c biogenesis protein